MATSDLTATVAVELDSASVERIRSQVAEAVRAGVRDGLDADLGVRHKGDGPELFGGGLNLMPPLSHEVVVDGDGVTVHVHGSDR